MSNLVDTSGLIQRNLPELPPRPVDGHKGLFGRVLIVGGNAQMLGAPTLAGTAALRMGSGLVQVCTPDSILQQVLSITPELIGLVLPESKLDTLLEAADAADAVAIGPGLGQTRQAGAALEALIELEKPMVLDADALNMMAAKKAWPASRFKAKAVLTPHPGEMKRLAKLLGRKEVPTDEPGRIEIATYAARAFACVVVLKGHHTVVADGHHIYVNQTGDSSLSKAGAGDVLSGILACLLGQQIERFTAACLATHIHGRAGELAGEKLGRRSVLARDVIDCLPGAIGELET